MTRTLIVPGLDGSPAPHWQHCWAATDATALTVEQMDWSQPCPDLWEAELAGAIFNHPDSILVGHSLGAITIARVLSRWPQVKVRGALLVAPAEPERSLRIARFAPVPDRPLGVPAIVVASRNDPWMSFARSGALAQGWGAELVDLQHAGHINADSGFGPLAGGLALRDALLHGRVPEPDPLPCAEAGPRRRRGERHGDLAAVLHGKPPSARLARRPDA